MDRSLVSYTPWGHKELDTTEVTALYIYIKFPSSSFVSASPVFILFSICYIIGFFGKYLIPFNFLLIFMCVKIKLRSCVNIDCIFTKR